MITIQFIFTKHAMDKIDAYGLNVGEIEAVVVNGRKWKETNTDKWRANMAGTEVIFQKEGEAIIIITVYEA